MAAKAVLPFGAEKADDTDPAEPANTELSIQCLTSRKYSITVQHSNSTYIQHTKENGLSFDSPFSIKNKSRSIKD